MFFSGKKPGRLLMSSISGYPCYAFTISLSKLRQSMMYSRVWTIWLMNGVVQWQTTNYTWLFSGPWSWKFKCHTGDGEPCSMPCVKIGDITYLVAACRVSDTHDREENDGTWLPNIACGIPKLSEVSLKTDPEFLPRAAVLTVSLCLYDLILWTFTIKPVHFLPGATVVVHLGVEFFLNVESAFPTCWYKGWRVALDCVCQQFRIPQWF